MTTAPAQLASVVQSGQVRPRSSSPRDRPRAHRRSSGGSLAPRRSSPLREVLHEEFDFLPGAKREALAKKIAAGISSQPDFFSVEQCRQIEAHIDELNELARRGAFQRFTVDKSPLRCKYFFGEGYTYGSQLERKGPGMEKLYPVGAIDAIPKWIKKYVVRPLEKAKVIPKVRVHASLVLNVATKCTHHSPLCLIRTGPTPLSSTTIFPAAVSSVTWIPSTSSTVRLSPAPSSQTARSPSAASSHSARSERADHCTSSGCLAAV